MPVHCRMHEKRGKKHKNDTFTGLGWLTNALHWTPAMLRFWRKPKGYILAVASERGRSPFASLRENAALSGSCLPSAPLRENQALETDPPSGDRSAPR